MLIQGLLIKANHSWVDVDLLLADIWAFLWVSHLFIYVWFQLCRVSVCPALPGCGHLLLLHRLQSGTGRSSHYSTHTHTHTRRHAVSELTALILHPRTLVFWFINALIPGLKIPTVLMFKHTWLHPANTLCYTDTLQHSQPVPLVKYSAAVFIMNRELDSVFSLLRHLCGVWRLCGSHSPSWPSCGFTTRTASILVGLVCPGRRICCWVTVRLKAPPHLLILQQHPPSLSNRQWSEVVISL